ncbi:type I restriction endonuclease subunit R [Haliangium ochraceum]|uniref:Type I restriction enzyme endonuclease subunit n=1 Tax=Haliangium ochraceum (strain DSM 14365 / JCM 11303 / SMP-2) TaxID=502025 RepID=D0LNE3_HALO1|nr:type I restriction endonuclease subunit R [Haliangium ochraceum]ACY15320.1 type I site-specific deoxyribonuclease, HsdR family [Haliangium ochraceum DSM 14365]
MSPSSRDWNELSQSEDPAIALLERLGYSYAAPEALEAERDNLRSPILEARLRAALGRLNPWLSDDNLTRSVATLTRGSYASLAEASEKLHTALTYGVALEQDRGDGKKSHTVRFFDFDQPSNNDFLVTRQFQVRGVRMNIYPDVVVFANGIPLAVIECKSPTLGERWRDQAIKQLSRYQELGDNYRNEGAPKLFETVQLVIACCGQGASYGTVGTPRRFWAEWKDPYPLTREQLADLLGRAPTPQDVALSGLLAPANLLDITRNFVAFDAESGRTVRKVCRYKQFMAVNKALARIHASDEPAARGGVVWHTQGSGKSLTMLWLALKLRRDPALENPALLIVTDRVDLDRQIRDTFTHCGFPNPEPASSVAHLKELLSQPGGKSVMTTVQKFQETSPAQPAGGSKRTVRPLYPRLSAAKNVFVMVDEAHRTQYRGLATNMRRALPNACFLGFTGTPIDKRDRSTLQTFGPYIDTYTIEQAVADGATVPIFYESRLAELRIEGQSLDRVFDRVFADRSDEEKSAIKKKYATERTVATAPARVEAICLDLIEHFERAIRPSGFKAQVVTVSRDAAVQYYETLQKLNGPPAALIMSIAHNDGAHLTRYADELSRDAKNRTIERFKEASAPEILVVCDMLLTGFDAPVEQVMYLDAPLKEHTLLQAIARTNRNAENKSYGLIVDYWGVSQDLQEALGIFSPGDVAGAMTPKEDELPRLEARHREVVGFFAGLAREARDDLDACVNTLADEDRRAEFDAAFKRFARSMELLLADPRAAPYRDDLAWLGKIRMAAKARYHDQAGLDIGDCSGAVRKLIEDAVRAEGVEILVKQVSLFSKEFGEKIEALGKPEARASEMEHAIRHEITVKLDENPAFYQSLRERLEEIVTMRKQQRVDAAKQLELFQDLIDELRGESNAAAALGLSETGYAIYGVLHTGGEDAAAAAGQGDDGQARAQAEQIEDVLRPHVEIVDWWQKDEELRLMRRAIKGVLRKDGVSADAMEQQMTEIIAIMKRRAGH